MLDEYKIKEGSLALALGVNRTYIAQLLSRVSHPSDRILGLIRLELMRRGVPKNTAYQVWLLGFRDSNTLPTRQDELSSTNSFKAGKMLETFLMDQKVTQADIHRATHIGQSTLSGFIRNRDFPNSHQQRVIASYLRKRGVPAEGLALWKKAVCRDRLYWTMLKNDDYPGPLIREVIEAIDERFALTEV